MHVEEAIFAAYMTSGLDDVPVTLHVERTISKVGTAVSLLRGLRNLPSRNSCTFPFCTNQAQVILCTKQNICHKIITRLSTTSNEEKMRIN